MLHNLLPNKRGLDNFDKLGRGDWCAFYVRRRAVLIGISMASPTAKNIKGACSLAESPAKARGPGPPLIKAVGPTGEVRGLIVSAREGAGRNFHALECVRGPVRPVDFTPPILPFCLFVCQRAPPFLFPYRRHSYLRYTVALLSPHHFALGPSNLALRLTVPTLTNLYALLSLRPASRKPRHGACRNCPRHRVSFC